MMDTLNWLANMAVKTFNEHQWACCGRESVIMVGLGGLMYRVFIFYINKHPIEAENFQCTEPISRFRSTPKISDNHAHFLESVDSQFPIPNPPSHKSLILPATWKCTCAGLLNILRAAF